MRRGDHDFGVCGRPNGVKRGSGRAGDCGPEVIADAKVTADAKLMQGRRNGVGTPLSS
jgi:hypothetical protein